MNNIKNTKSNSEKKHVKDIKIFLKKKKKKKEKSEIDIRISLVTPFPTTIVFA